MKKILWLSIIVLSVIIGNASAVQKWWGGATSNDWGVGSNWGDGNVPGAADEADINGGGAPVVTTNAYQAGWLKVGTWGNASLTVSSGSLRVANFAWIGDAGTGSLAVNGGTFTTVADVVAGHISGGTVGNGTITVSSGNFAAGGDLYLSGGNGCTAGMTVSGTGNVDVNGTGLYVGGTKGNAGSGATLTVNGGTVDTTLLSVGSGASGSSILNVNGGAVTTMGGQVWIGAWSNGVLNQTNGTIYAQWNISVGDRSVTGGTPAKTGTGTVNLSGGTLRSGGVLTMSSGSQIIISSAGKLQIDASWHAEAQAAMISYIENGQIVAGSGYKLKVAYGASAGPSTSVTITAVNQNITDPNQMWFGTVWQTPHGGDGKWHYPGNWGRGYVPGPNDRTYINSIEATPAFPVVSSGAQTAYSINTGSWGPGKLTVSGGSLTVGTNVTIGDNGDGTLVIVSPGAMNVGGQLKLGFKGGGASGNGDVNMVSGSLTTGDEIAVGLDSLGFGKFVQRGGNLTTPYLYIGRWGRGTGTMYNGTASIGNVLGVSVNAYDANFVMYNGTITDVQQTWVGYHPTDSYAHGVLDMRGGSITSKWSLNIGYTGYSWGVLNLYGGTYTHWCDIAVGDGSLINVAGGALVITNQGRDMATVYNQLVGYRDSGQLVAYGGGINTVVHIDKDSPITGQIRVWGENLAPQAQASNPHPADGVTVYTVVTLQWLQGIGASTQNVYVGTDLTAVTNATTASPEFKGTLAGSAASFVPTVTIGKTTYWRIDTVKADTTVVKGTVWSFTLGGYIVLEDCQSYTTTATNWSALGTGSAALNTDTSSLGYKWGYQHGKAVDLSYNNVSIAYAEAVYTMPTAFNTTLYNGAILRLDIHGYATNVGATEPLSIILEDSAGHRSKASLYTKTGLDKDLVQENWEPWYGWLISLGDFTQSGFDATSVKKVIVHVGGTVASGAHGKITIDDIRIYPPLCTAEHILYGDFTYDCKVDISDMFAIARDWLMAPTTITAAAPSTGPILWYKFNESSGASAHDEIAGNNGTLRNGPTWVAGGGPDGSNCINIHGGRTSGSYGVSVPAAVFAGITNTISFSVWVKGDATNPVSPTGNVFTGSNNATDVWDTASGIPGAVSTKIYFQAPFESGVVSFGAGLTLPNTYDYITWTTSFVNDWRGVWVHYALIKDGTAGTMAIYRNGELVSQIIEGATKPISDIQYFWIGATQLFGYEGQIDDFRIYDYALTPAQVVSLASKASFTQPLLNWRSDANGDGKVDFKDFAAMASRWLAGEQLWPRN